MRVAFFSLLLLCLGLSACREEITSGTEVPTQAEKPITAGDLWFDSPEALVRTVLHALRTKDSATLQAVRVQEKLYLGVMVGYWDLDQAEWRVIREVELEETTELVVEVARSSVSIRMEE